MSESKATKATKKASNKSSAASTHTEPAGLPKKPAKGSKKPLDREVLYRGSESIPAPLTKPELLDSGQRLARQEETVAEFIESKKSTVAQLAAEQKKLEAERGRLARIVRDESELRRVEVESVADFPRLVLETVRLDTHEVLRSRPLTQDERQRLLPGMGAPGKGSSS